MDLEIKSVAYWGPRKEGVVQCTRRFLRYMEAIAELGPPLARWHEKAYTRKEALMRRLDIDRASLRRLLDEGRNRSEMDGSVIRDLGFYVDIWNGAREDRAVSLSALCGKYSEYAGPNHVFLRYFSRYWLDRWLDAEVAVALVRAAVDAWEPDWAGMCARQATRKAIDRGEFDPMVPFVDWVLYHRRKRRRKLPAPARVVFEMHGGECILIKDTPVDPDDPDDRAHVRAVARALGL